MLEDTKRVQGNHRIVLTGRKTAVISGVMDVLSFDTKEVLLETDMGILLLKGDDLHVNRLTLEKGEVDLDGRIDSIAYSENSHLKGEDGFFKKLFK
nr:sporulation protein YabP [Acetivibrio ethanolgignens]